MTMPVYTNFDAGQAGEPDFSKKGLDDLARYSPSDAIWDVHRAQTDGVAAIYASSADFGRYAARTAECSGILRFAWANDAQTGESKLKLREARFCRVRHCPVCQWRRSLLWKFRFYEALPAVIAQNPQHRFIFLTLTTRNCPITLLGQTLTDLNAAWHRLIKRPEFKRVAGWVRTTEVTRGGMIDARTGVDIPKKLLSKVPLECRRPKDCNAAHPHFHCLLMVSPSYFKNGYVSQKRWGELWGECAKLDYTPIVDVRAVKGEMADSLAELLKYSVKPDDMIMGDGEWFLELTRQTHKRRFIASGGLLKDILKDPGDETNLDLILAEGPAEGDDDGSRFAFEWGRARQKYARCPAMDSKAKR